MGSKQQCERARGEPEEINLLVDWIDEARRVDHDSAAPHHAKGLSDRYRRIGFDMFQDLICVRASKDSPGKGRQRKSTDGKSAVVTVA